jgi:exodeoxyribonuclease VII small subunit
MMSGKKAKNEEPSFGEAMQSLEEILERIEGEEIDIDELAGQLGAAAELLEICRAKLRKAELEVTQIVEGLEEKAEDADED